MGNKRGSGSVWWVGEECEIRNVGWGGVGSCGKGLLADCSK